jgi:hypothetical protein
MTYARCRRATKGVSAHFAAPSARTSAASLDEESGATKEVLAAGMLTPVAGARHACAPSRHSSRAWSGALPM